MAGVIGWIADEDGTWDCGHCEDCSAYGTEDCMANEDDHATIDDLFADTDYSIACIIEDAQDHGFVIVVDDDNLYLMNHCPECQGNAMMTFHQVATGRRAYRCRCGHKAWM